MADSSMFTVHQTIGNIPCCKCGVPIVPNGANMCVTCLRSEVDITEGLKKHAIIMHCPDCERYFEPPRTWIKAQLESKELLKFCIARLGDLTKKVRLIDALFVWTEPHSKRVKVKLTVQKEVYNGAVLEQTYVVEFTQQDHMCDACTRIAANPDQWVAAVQLRQHVSHRRTFFYIEQLILKHGAASKAIKIKQVDQGIDFFFGNRSHALKFVEFVGKVAPIKYRNDKQLVSHDSHNNNYNYKFTFSVEICPICREDLICLPPKVANSLGNFGPIVICTKVTDQIALLDPFTLRHCWMNAEQYWRVPFRSLSTSRQLVEYVVIEVEPLSNHEVEIGGSKCKLADVHVARKSDFGRNDNMFYIRTHLGHLLNSGDYALGYDTFGANTNDIELDKYRGLTIPDAILVKKSYEEKREKKRGKARPWKLRQLNMEVDESKGKTNPDKVASEYEEFLRDLEENPELRFNISLYRDREYEPSENASMTTGDGEDLPSVPLDELLADLEISDGDDGEDSMSG